MLYPFKSMTNNIYNDYIIKIDLNFLKKYFIVHDYICTHSCKTTLLFYIDDNGLNHSYYICDNCIKRFIKICEKNNIVI